MADQSFRSTLSGKVLDLLIVIVGITIAFQVDRWKERRDTAQEEKFFLQSMMSDLDKDINEYQDNIKDLSKDHRLVYGTLLRLGRNEDISDSLGFVAMNALSVKTFEGHNNTYLTITTSNGLGVISDPGIRELTIEHYRLYSSLGKFEARYHGILGQLKDFLTPHIYFNRSGKLLNKSIAKDAHTENLLTLTAIQQREGTWRYQASIEKAKELKGAIEAFLGK